MTVVSNCEAANTPSASDAADKATLAKLAELRHEHRALDGEIQALMGSGDQLQLTRLKKRKLMLRDQIAKIEDQIVPNIIA